MTSSTPQTEFIHSTPVPRIYKIASKIAKNVKEGKDSLKNLVFAEKHVNIKTVYALVVETFKRDELIDALIRKSGLLVKEPRFNLWLAKILISELLWGKNKMSKGSKPVDTILSYEKVLKTLLEDLDSSVQPVLKHNVVKPRYVRVNTLKITTDEAVNNFRDEGWIFVPFFNKSDYKGFQKRIDTLKSDEFMKDIHIPDLLIFPPKTEFYQHQAYKSSCIILQDKASCLPVHILAPTPGSIVLDTCAAPGMKSTQLAALLQNTGTVYAVELNPKRANLLKELVESASATCIKTIFKDVMQVTADDCPDIEYILVDPSCSGSGITDRIEIEKLDLPTKTERLKKLCNFQAKLLRHTMTAFPKAKRIVYSTCSINSEENEDVVRQTLETSRHFKLVDAKKSLQSWNTKTSSLYPDLGNMCIFATPEEDKTNGFFVAVFERLQEGEKNPYLNYQLCKFFDKESRKNNNFCNNQETDVFCEKKENWNRNSNTQENERSSKNSPNSNENYYIAETSSIEAEYQNKCSDKKISKKKKINHTTEETAMKSIINTTNNQKINSDNMGSNEVTPNEEQSDPSEHSQSKKSKNIHNEKNMNEIFPENLCSNECDVIERKDRKKMKKMYKDNSEKTFSENSIDQNTISTDVKKKHKKLNKRGSDNTEGTVELETVLENSSSNSVKSQTEKIKSKNSHKEKIGKNIDDSVELDLSSIKPKKKNEKLLKEQNENVKDSKVNVFDDSSLVKKKNKNKESFEKENAIDEEEKRVKKSHKRDKKTELLSNQYQEAEENNERKKNKKRSKDLVLKDELALSNSEAKEISENTEVSAFNSDKQHKKKRKHKNSNEQGNVTDESFLELPESNESTIKAEKISIKTGIKKESNKKKVENEISEITKVGDFNSDKQHKKKRKNKNSSKQGNVTDESFLEVLESRESTIKTEKISVKTEIKEESEQKEVENEISEITEVSDSKSDKQHKKKRKNKNSSKQGNVTDESFLDLPESHESTIKTEMKEESEQTEVEKPKKRKKRSSTANNDLEEPKSKKMRKI